MSDKSNLPKKRIRVFMRDGYKCVLCGIEDDLTIDHIIPVSRGGSNRMKNLQTLCRTCNQNKGDRIM